MDATFIEHAGLSWRVLAGGWIERSPHCCRCHKPMVARLSYQPLHCSSCGLLSRFKQSELRTVFESIPKGPLPKIADRFFQHGGLAWKQQRHGIVELMPFCASCLVPLTTHQDFENLGCPQCGSETTLHYGDVPQAWANATHSIVKPATRFDRVHR